MVTNDGIVVGSVDIDASTFPPGTVLTVGNPKRDPKTKERCDENVRRASPLLELTLGDEDKGLSRDLDPPVTINLVSERRTGSKTKDYCMASSESSRQPLRCLEDSKPTVDRSPSSRKGSQEDFALVSSNTTHFTSFAVLLASFENQCDAWIWKASLALVGFAIVFSFFMFLLSRNKRFIAFVYGYDEEDRVSKVVQKANRAKS